MITLGADIGGTHISAALVHDGLLLTGTYRRAAIDPAADAQTLLDAWAGLLNEVIVLAEAPVQSIGLAMPGPFDYDNGISLIRGLNKYESLYGINIREALRERLSETLRNIPICFENDAACFGLGEARSAGDHRKLIAITLGTGLGACFIEEGKLLTAGAGVPPNGYLYNMPFKDGIAEDYISARWLLNACPANDVRELAERAATDEKAAAVFWEFGANLKTFLTPWIKRFEADALVIGGNIARSFHLFQQTMRLVVPIQVSQNTEHAAIVGAAGLTEQTCAIPPARRSLQPRLPKQIGNAYPGYNIYPFEPLGHGRIFSGYPSLAQWIIRQKQVRLDGYAGIDWNLVRTCLCAALRAEGARVLWYETSAWLKPEEEIETLVSPFLGEPGSVWGTKTTLNMEDLFLQEWQTWQPHTKKDRIIIIAGPGAGLSGWNTPIIYFDLPKNEIQYRMRAGSATNLGAIRTGSPAEMYKRSYFVDWVVLNRYRRRISKDITLVVDGQREEDPNWTIFDSLRSGLQAMSRDLIRARPWFEPGVWGGQWLKRQIPALSQQEVNYAWSFELIAPENGIIFESDGLLLEIAFDWLMQCESRAILGIDADRFGEEFPIRFDFLDTFGGGNLSIQCHPSLAYIREHFGETITQDETYYILDCKPGAGVYLGFNDDIDPTAFREALGKSQTANEPVDIEKYVQRHPAHKHDLFLIPNRTIHGSGVDNLVLEISATPYIFTFKMYDWMRLDLDGMPRPINIGHAFHNLDFGRKGTKVQETLISKPQILQQEPAMTLEILPTHPEHFYAIHRITLTGSTRIATDDRCHLLMLVEGTHLTVKTSQGRTHLLYYAETFIIPAAAGEYQLINNEPHPIIIIKAFVK